MPKQKQSGQGQEKSYQAHIKKVKGFEEATKEELTAIETTLKHLASILYEGYFRRKEN